MKSIKPQDVRDGHGRADGRSAIVCVLIVVAIGVFSGRVARVRSADGQSAMLSANDRSRWCTIRALVDHGTYRIDSIIRERDDRGRRVWHTIDRVRHRGWDGQEHDYSSKPPLLPTLLAGEYWLIRLVTGATLESHPFFVVRLMVWVTNGALLVLWWWAAARWARTWAESVWATAVVFAMATLGTFLTTFAVTLNNHLPAAVACAWSADALIRIGRGDRSRWTFALAGGGAALAAANELPALSLLVAVLVYLVYVDRRSFLIGAVPAAAIVTAAFFGTNYAAHGSLRPPYAHRGEGRLLVQLPASEMSKPALGPLSDDWHAALRRSGIRLSDRAEWQTTAKEGRWAIWDIETGTRLSVLEQAGRYEVREWDDWYDYAGSYWHRDHRKGVDRGEPNLGVYAFHVLIGHHGVFSLTPFWVFTVVGCWWWVRSEDRVQRQWALLTIVLTMACVAFFLTRPQGDRNYGGMTTGFRWLFWLIPLWWAPTLAVVSRLGSHRIGRLAVYACVAISILSATYGALQPWSHPWLYDYWKALGWI